MSDYKVGPAITSGGHPAYIEEIKDGKIKGVFYDKKCWIAETWYDDGTYKLAGKDAIVDLKPNRDLEPKSIMSARKRKST